MQVRASDFYQLYRPSKCELRPYFIENNMEASPPGPYEEVIEILGQRHELSHLEELGDHTDLSSGETEVRIDQTIEAVNSRTEVIYHPYLVRQVQFGDNSIRVSGEPDFLLWKDDRYVVRDAKMSRRIAAKDHPEIILQLQLYGFLFEKTFPEIAFQLQVYSGKCEVVGVEYEGEERILEATERIVALRNATERPISPVGWSKCSACGYRSTCWDAAVSGKNIATLSTVDAGLATRLYEMDVSTFEDILGRFQVEELSELQRPWGSKTAKVGKKAESILRSAKAMVDKSVINIGAPKIPDISNFVMFDVEGLPPYLDELDKVYLWGLQVFGEEPGGFIGVTADFGPDGDKKCWFDFLEAAELLFDAHGDIPFVHWHIYEKTKIRAYVDRWGDNHEIAERILSNLLDLHRIVSGCFVLPIPSLGLKVVEEFVGYERTQEEYGGTWSMAQYIKAVETEDESEREKLMSEILKYNAEDLEATWAVFQWIQSQ